MVDNTGKSLSFFQGTISFEPGLSFLRDIFVCRLDGSA